MEAVRGMGFALITLWEEVVGKDHRFVSDSRGAVQLDLPESSLLSRYFKIQILNINYFGRWDGYNYILFYFNVFIILDSL